MTISSYLVKQMKKVKTKNYENKKVLQNKFHVKTHRGKKRNSLIKKN